jgi:thymidine kinase
MPEINIHNSLKSGWIEVITGPMFSGKTEELIRRLRRAILANQKVEIFKPSIDTRNSNTKIVSHDKNSLDSVSVDYSQEIMQKSDGFSVIGIDEAQFFDPEIVSVCNHLANNGTRIIIAGLDMDFMGKPFGPMPELLIIAEYVTKLNAICVECGNPAHYSHRIVNQGQQILLGEKDKYIPLCRKCFINFNNIKKVK